MNKKPYFFTKSLEIHRKVIFLKDEKYSNMFFF
jgi:hypothetical protein